MASLRWIVRNRAWSWWYLVRYWRFMIFRLRNPHIITEGFVFLVDTEEGWSWVRPLTGVPVVAVANLHDLLAFAGESADLVHHRDDLLAYRARYGSATQD